MAEENAVVEAKRPKTEYTEVTMTDGRKVSFAGKRKFLKETLIDATKIEVADGVVQLNDGAVKLRMDWRDGHTLTIDLPISKKLADGTPLAVKYLGHGAEQKFGDELASPADKPMSEDDQVLAIETLYALHAEGKWGVGRAEGGGGVSGASIVIRALAEVKGKTVEEIKNALNKRIESTPGLTRQALYASFRTADTPVKAVIQRMEAEETSKKSKVDATAELAALDA